MALFFKLVDVGLPLFIGLRVVYHKRVSPQPSVHECIGVDVEQLSMALCDVFFGFLLQMGLEHLLWLFRLMHIEVLRKFEIKRTQVHVGDDFGFLFVEVWNVNLLPCRVEG